MERVLPITNAKYVFKLSLLAYFKPIISFLFYLVLYFIARAYIVDGLNIVYQIINDFFSSIHLKIELPPLKSEIIILTINIMTLALCVFGIKKLIDILRLYVVKIYVDNTGVWVYGGLFSFTRNIYGVAWKNIDVASTKNGFFNQLFNAFSVKVTNRFKDVVEINVSLVHNGKALIQLINNQADRYQTMAGTIVQQFELD